MRRSTASAADEDEKFVAAANAYSDEEYSDEESVYSDDEPLLAESIQKGFKYEHIPECLIACAEDLKVPNCVLSRLCGSSTQWFWQECAPLLQDEPIDCPCAEKAALS